MRLQGGCGWTVGAGTGLVVARRAGGSWTPPSALGFYSCGWGFQAGGVLSDLLIVLRNQCARPPPLFSISQELPTCILNSV